MQRHRPDRHLYRQLHDRFTARRHARRSAGSSRLVAIARDATCDSRWIGADRVVAGSAVDCRGIPGSGRKARTHHAQNLFHPGDQHCQAAAGRELMVNDKLEFQVTLTADDKISIICLKETGPFKKIQLLYIAHAFVQYIAKHANLKIEEVIEDLSKLESEEENTVIQ